MRRPIVTAPAPILQTVARPVQRFDRQLRHLIADLWDTALAVGGLGLAAPQINVDQAVCVVNGAEGRYTLINPSVLELSHDTIRSDEACLSLPGYLAVGVTRATAITVEYATPQGEYHIDTFTGVTAIIAQHELDHLHGLLISQVVPPERWVRLDP